MTWGKIRQIFLEEAQTTKMTFFNISPKSRKVGQIRMESSKILKNHKASIEKKQPILTLPTNKYLSHQALLRHCLRNNENKAKITLHRRIECWNNA